ncbi:FAD/NAD(P)-binding domain-containing protein [Mycena filopes]|nr:FAD/NAD(P)-binding domain-containing protein [Mycena filopes]
MSSIVIVGAGIAGGSTLARTLSKKLPSAKITLIDARPYTISLPTLPRMTVSDGNDLLTPRDSVDKLFLSNGTRKARHITHRKQVPVGPKGSVVLADGREFAYDVLALAPGSVWEGPIDFPLDAAAVPAFLAEQRAQFKKAQKIVLVGGGAVGVEFAGEIKDVWPEKEVTIVHGDTAIMNATYPAKFRTNLAQSLEACGINIVLEDYLDELLLPGAATVTTRRDVSSRLTSSYVPTRGPRPRTEFVATSLGAATLDERKQIKVKPTLQLIEHSDIFAIGDAIDTVEQKQVMKAAAHAAIVAANIVAYLSNRPLKPYKGSIELIVVTNGKDGGQAYFGILWGITLGSWFASMVKSKNLLVPRSRSAMGY